MTYRPKSDFLHVMQSRGFMQDCTDTEGLDDALRAGTIPAYIGFDATATSLHVGSLIQIMMLRWLQKTGHKPITLMGGGTTKVGDPSFRSDERPLLTPDRIAANIAGIRQVFAKYVSYGDAATDAVMPDNAEWLDALNYLDFLRDVGRHFSVNRMLSFESVKSRLDREQSLSFLEFNYMILQAYDFAELNRRYGCRLQMGGSDQWGNIVNGIDLTRRLNGVEVWGLTSPLLTTADGGKMGKTASGAIWLNADMLGALRFLAVLAQHRRCRCRPLPQALHRASARGMRPPRRPRRRRDQRGQDHPRERRDHALPRRRGRRRRRSHRPRGLRGGRHRRRSAPPRSRPRRGARARHLHRATAGEIRPRRLGQGSKAPDRRGRCAPRRRPRERCRPPAHRRRSRRPPQALRRSQAPRPRRPLPLNSPSDHGHLISRPVTSPRPVATCPATTLQSPHDGAS